MASKTSSCSHRFTRRSLPVVHRDLMAYAAQSSNRRAKAYRSRRCWTEREGVCRQGTDRRPCAADKRSLACRNGQRRLRRRSALWEHRARRPRSRRRGSACRRSSRGQQGPCADHGQPPTVPDIGDGVRHDQVVLDVDRQLHVVADDPGALPLVAIDRASGRSTRSAGPVPA